MKYAAVFALSSVLLAGTAAFAATDDLTAVYKKGRLTLTPDPDFAPGADWGALFFDRTRKIRVAPDGSIFVASQRDHTISKFDAGGRLLKTFGRHGQGPGDLESPSELSLLDGRTLVVGGYISGRKISLFNLDGEFQAVLKTRHPPSRPTALGNGKIAYIGVRAGASEFQGNTFVMKNINTVVILDVRTGAEREVTSITTTLNEPKDGTVMIAPAARGDLLVGLTTRPEIEIYDGSGTKKGVLTLTIDRLPVTKKITETYQVKVFTREGGKGMTTAYPLGEFLPYYADMTADALGNLIVFKMSEDPKTGPLVIQAYSPAGKLLGETEIDRAGFDIPLNKWIHQQLNFTERGLFGLFPRQGDELETPRLFRVRLQP